MPSVIKISIVLSNGIFPLLHSSIVFNARVKLANPEYPAPSSTTFFPLKNIYSFIKNNYLKISNFSKQKNDNASSAGHISKEIQNCLISS